VRNVRLITSNNYLQLTLYNQNLDNNRGPGVCVTRVAYFALIENTEILRNEKNIKNFLFRDARSKQASACVL